MAVRVFSFYRSFAFASAILVAVTAVANAAPTVPRKFTKPPGAFYVTLDDGTKLPISGMRLTFGSSTGSARTRVVSATLSFGDADASAFLKDAIAHAVVTNMTVTSPKTLLKFTNTVFAGFVQDGSATDFTATPQRIAITSVGSSKGVTVDTTVSSALTDQQPPKVSAAVPKPSLTVPQYGTFALVSDTFLIAHPVDSASGAASGKATVKVSVKFANGDGFAIADAALENTVFKTATLATGGGSFEIRDLGVGATTATFDASGTPTVASDLTFSDLTTRSTATAAKTTTAKLKLLVADGEIALIAAKFGTSHGSSGGGLGAGKVQNTASFTVADSSAMPLIADAMKNTVSFTLSVVTPDARVDFTNATLANGSDTSGAGGSATFSIQFQKIAVTIGGKKILESEAAAAIASEKAEISAAISVPNITFPHIGTLPLATETFSTVSPTDTSSGIATGRTNTSYAFTIAGAAGLPLWQAARIGTSFKTAHVKLPSIAYDFTNASVDEAFVDVDKNGATTVGGTLAYQSVSATNGTQRAAIASPVGPLTLSYVDAKGTQTGTLTKARISLIGGAGNAKATAEIAVAEAAELIEDVVEHATLKTLTIASPKSTVLLSDIAITKSAQSGNGATVSLSFQRISITGENGKWDADFFGPGGTPAAPLGSTGPKPNAPYLSASKLGTFGLASESISQQVVADAVTGASSGKSFDSVEFVSTPDSAIPLFETFGAGGMEQANLATATDSFSLTSIARNDVRLDFSQAGVSTTTAHAKVAKLTVSSKPKS